LTVAGWSCIMAAAEAWGCGGSNKSLSNGETPMQLSHEQTLDWIQQHRAWRLAKKVKPIWARALQADEIGRPFHTADHATEVAQEGFWLCVGVAGEPWFQTREKIEAKYDRAREENKQFSFDQQACVYQVFQPKGDVQNWAAQVSGPQVEGFYIRPNYDMQHPLYSPAGGYVVKDHVPDPYRDNPDDVWLVQQSLFESTYELLLTSGDSP
jgi:hypothetical protein